eukprot:SAG31_NODE_3749_length_3922_cov_1.586144_2_plen_157_part_00
MQRPRRRPRRYRGAISNPFPLGSSAPPLWRPAGLWPRGNLPRVRRSRTASALAAAQIGARIIRRMWRGTNLYSYSMAVHTVLVAHRVETEASSPGTINSTRPRQYRFGTEGRADAVDGLLFLFFCFLKNTHTHTQSVNLPPRYPHPRERRRVIESH